MKDDGMMSMSNTTCPRLSSAFKAIREDKPTLDMLHRNKAFLEPLIYAPLRAKTGLTNATEPIIVDLGNFIHWTKRDRRQVNFELTAKDLALVETMIEV